MSAPGVAGQIDTFLKGYGSPMAGLGSVYVAAGKKYGVDPRLPAAISIAESSGGKHILGSFNAWGWGPGRSFASWEDGISTVTKGLKTGYIDLGLTTPAEIAKKYAPSSAGNDPTHWSQTVSDFMLKMGSSPSRATPLSTGPSSAASTVTPVPSSKLLPPSTIGLESAVFQNLGDIARYGHSTSGALSNLLSGRMQDLQIDQLNLQSQKPLGGEPAPSSTVPSSQPSSPPPSPGSIYNTAKGQPVPKSTLTSIGGEHPTGNLPGYPAHDYFAPAGSPVVSPVNGTVRMLSGHPPSAGVFGKEKAFGWSLYIAGDDGHDYYLTHLGSRTVSQGTRLSLGEQIGTVGDFAKYGTPSHIHEGIH